MFLKFLLNVFFDSRNVRSGTVFTSMRILEYVLLPSHMAVWAQDYSILKTLKTVYLLVFREMFLSLVVNGVVSLTLTPERTFLSCNLKVLPTCLQQPPLPIITHLLHLTEVCGVDLLMLVSSRYLSLVCTGLPPHFILSLLYFFLSPIPISIPSMRTILM